MRLLRESGIDKVPGHRPVRRRRHRRRGRLPPRPAQLPAVLPVQEVQAKRGAARREGLPRGAMQGRGDHGQLRTTARSPRRRRRKRCVPARPPSTSSTATGSATSCSSARSGNHREGRRRQGRDLAGAFRGTFERHHSCTRLRAHNSSNASASPARQRPSATCRASRSRWRANRFSARRCGPAWHIRHEQIEMPTHLYVQWQSVRRFQDEVPSTY